MAVREGTVLGVDRTTGTCRIDIDGIERIASYDSRRPLWPGCTARARGGPPWRVIEPIGDRRRLIHDDFTRVPTLTATGAAACDRNWNFTTAATLGTGSLAQVTSAGLGVARIARTGTSSVTTSQLSGDDNALVIPASPAGLHVAAQFKVVDSTVTTGASYFIGLAAKAYLLVTTDSGAMVPYLSGTSDSPNERSELATETWYWADVMLLESSLAALWIDGNGPVVNADPLGAAVFDTTSVFMMTAVGVATGRLDIDCVTVDVVTPVASLLDIEQR